MKTESISITHKHFNLQIKNLKPHKSFTDHLQEILEDKLTESSFGVEEFSRSIGLSRMQLHRKLKAITGLSSN